MRIDGKADVSPVVFWDEESLPLLGAVTLEILSLGIDPVNRRLIPVDALLLPAWARPGTKASRLRRGRDALAPRT